MAQKKKEPTTRIEGIVDSMRNDPKRFGTGPDPTLKAIREKYNLKEGGGENKDIMRIAKQNEINTKIYDVYHHMQGD